MLTQYLVRSNFIFENLVCRNTETLNVYLTMKNNKTVLCDLYKRSPDADIRV